MRALRQRVAVLEAEAREAERLGSAMETELSEMVAGQSEMVARLRAAEAVEPSRRVALESEAAARLGRLLTQQEAHSARGALQRWGAASAFAAGARDASRRVEAATAAGGGTRDVRGAGAAAAAATAAAAAAVAVAPARHSMPTTQQSHCLIPVRLSWWHNQGKWWL